MTTVDAVVIGAGPNGLVAANDLADHGGRLTFRGKAAHPYDATIDDPKVARVVRRAVCRSSYVHPRVYETFNTGELVTRWTCQAPRQPRGLSADERRFWELLARQKRRR